MRIIRKVITKREIIEQLRRGKVLLPPLSLPLLKVQPETAETFVSMHWLKQSGGTARQSSLLNAEPFPHLRHFRTGSTCWNHRRSRRAAGRCLLCLSLMNSNWRSWNRKGSAALTCAATAWWLYRESFPYFGAARKTVFRPRPRSRISIEGTVRWSEEFSSSVQLMTRFKRFALRLTG